VVWGLLKSLSFVEITPKVGLRRKWLGEVFCQLTNTSECDSTSRNFLPITKAIMKHMLYFIITDGQTFGPSAVSVFRKFCGKLSWYYYWSFHEICCWASFNQVLHMRNKYRNRLEINKIGGNAIRLKLTDLQSALKNLQVTARGTVRSSWNQDCGAETQISGSSSSCKHPKLFAPAPEWLGPLKMKNNCILY